MPSFLSVTGTLIIVGSALWVVVTKDFGKRSSQPSKGVTGATPSDSLNGGDGDDSEGEQGILLKHLEEGRESDEETGLRPESAHVSSDTEGM